MGIVDKVRSLFQGSRLNIAERFELMREAVSGTMSKFYMARDRRTGEVVGLKVCDLKKTQFFEGRFASLHKPPEGEIAIQFEHPLIVKTLEYGTTIDEEHYLVMEYLNGPGLNSFIMQRSSLLDGQRVHLIRLMATALKVVHDAGFIHRDVCPRNFICAPDATQLKLIDFGLTLPATKDYTQPGNRTGTPSYMAPEVLRRRPTDQRVDIFAFGVTSYQLCTLSLPWPGEDVSGKAAIKHDTHEPLDIFELRPELNRQLGESIMRCLSVHPEQRPPSMEAFLREIRKVEHEDEHPSPQP